MHRALSTVLLLVGSNIFMTFAWYWHLKHKGWSLLMAIGISWLIALPEYCLQVPANRLGNITMQDGVNVGGPFTAPQLKIIQEAITLIVFSVFTTMVLKDRPRWNDMLAFVLVLAAVAVSVLGRAKAPA